MSKHISIFRISAAFMATVLLLSVLLILTACAGKSLKLWTTDSPPLTLVPATDAGIDDQRGVV